MKPTDRIELSTCLMGNWIRCVLSVCANSGVLLARHSRTYKEIEKRPECRHIFDGFSLCLPGELRTRLRVDYARAGDAAW